MAGKCSSCGQTLPEGQTAKPTFVPIGAERKFASICRQMAMMPEATSQHKEALSDLPTTVARYKQLTVGQWKMFCAITKAITGAWPEDKEKFAREDPEPERHELPDEAEIPF